jgi:hypothetical protein
VNRGLTVFRFNFVLSIHCYIFVLTISALIFVSEIRRSEIILGFMKIRHLFQCHYGKHLKADFIVEFVVMSGQILVALTTLTAMKFNREEVDIQIVLN